MLTIPLLSVGMVRSPIFTTVMQVASRLLLVWGIVNSYPAATSISPAYSSMLVAWSVSEVIRYSYFVMNLRGWVPGFVMWLRYGIFLSIGDDGPFIAGWLASLTVGSGQVQHVLRPVSVGNL